MLEHNALPALFTLIKSCNRSTPHLELIKAALNTCIHLSRCATTVHALWHPAYVEVLADLIQMYRGTRAEVVVLTGRPLMMYRADKEEVFSRAVKVLTYLTFDNPHRARELALMQPLVKRLRSVMSLLDRKAAMEAQFVEKQAYKAATTGTISHAKPPITHHNALRALLQIIAAAEHSK
jgi:abnormal spindle-like microcephaly-associated protein